MKTNKEMCNIKLPHYGFKHCPCYTNDLVDEYKELKKSKWKYFNVKFYWLKFRLK